MMPLPARAIKSSDGSTVGDRNRVPAPERSDLGGVFKGMPDTPTDGVVHARDLRKPGIGPWVHGHQRRCARFLRSAVKIGNPRYYELRKAGERILLGRRGRRAKRLPASKKASASTERPCPQRWPGRLLLRWNRIVGSKEIDAVGVELSSTRASTPTAGVRMSP